MTPMMRIDKQIAAAARRAARDRDNQLGIAVYVDDPEARNIWVRDAHAAPPNGLVPYCVAQFWSERHGQTTVQVRYRDGESGFLTLLDWELAGSDKP